MRLPPLGSLRAFEAAARLNGIAAAAAELHVTHGAVSKQVQILERDLGVALFERRNRAIHLTRPGRWLAERLGSVFGGLEQAVSEFRRRETASGPPTISCEPSLCLRMLIPSLGDLKAATGLDVHVLAAGGPVEFGRGHVDIAIRRSDFPLPPGIEATVLAPEWMGPVMPPALATRDFGALPRIHSTTRPDAWAAWSRGASTPFGGPDIRYEHFFLALQAAEAGQGVAMASLHMVADALASGRLCAPFGFAPDGTHYLALRPRAAADARHDAVVAWLRARLSERGDRLRAPPDDRTVPDARGRDGDAGIV